MSIRWKFVAVCILIVFVPIFFLNKYSIDFFDRFTRIALERHMIDHAYVIGNEYAGQSEQQDFNLQSFRKRLERYGEELQTRIRIVSTNGTVIADSEDGMPGEDISDLKEIRKALEGEYGARNQLTPDRQYMYYYIALPIERDGKLIAIAQLSRHTSHIIGAINRMIASHRLAYAVAIPIAVAIAVLTALSLIHPLRRLTRAARRFARGQQSFECRRRGGRDEIAQLEEAIGSMAGEIESKNAYNRDFLAAAAHELKTPLAAIRAAAEVLEDGAFENSEARGRFIANILFETRRLDQLVGELRELTRVDAESVRANSRICEYNACVADIIERIRPTLPENCAAIELRPAAGKLRARVVPEQIEQVLTNLIENAARYTPADGRIDIEIGKNGDGNIATTVSDNGAGIAPEYIEKVFERFFTTEPERAVNAHGAGLGLAIAKSIVINHGGEIHVESTPGHGSKFTFALPVSGKRT